MKIQKKTLKIAHNVNKLYKTAITLTKYKKVVKTAFLQTEICKRLIRANNEHLKFLTDKLKQAESGIYLNKGHLIELGLRGVKAIPEYNFNLFYDFGRKFFFLIGEETTQEYKFKPEETTGILNKLINLDFL